MSAYYVLTHTVTGMERYRNEYIPGTWPILSKHDGEIVAVSMQAEVLQGEPPQGIIIVRFPSAEVIREFVNDPEYAPLKKIRLETTTNASAVLVPAFEMPGS